MVLISLDLIFLAKQDVQIGPGCTCGIVGPVMAGLPALFPDFSCALVFWLVFGGMLISAVGIILAAVGSTPNNGIGAGDISDAIAGILGIGTKGRPWFGME
jgi:hypothetical protein